MSKSRLVPWLGFGATLVGGVASVARGPSRSPTDKTPPPADAELAAAAGVDPTRLIVDFRDDVSAETLANNGFTEIPISDYSAKDRLYRIDSRARTRRPRRRPSCPTIPASRASTSSRSRASRPARDAGRRGGRPAGGSMEAECQAAPRPAAASRTTPASSTSGTCASSGMPDAWKRGNGKGVMVAVIDTGVTKVADLGRHQVRPRLQLPRQQRQRRRRPRPRHPRRRAPSRSRPTTSSASRASPTAPPSCRSRC